MLWMCAIISLPLFILAYVCRDVGGLTEVFLWIGGAPIAATIVGFFYFMIASPQRLQSEDYQIRHETLELIRTKGSDLAVLPSSLEAISNPAVKALPAKEGN